MADLERSTLDNGAELVTERIPEVRSVALGLWVRTGSRDEDPAHAGVSHFLEHLLFKGTAEHSAIEISELFDSMGAAANAATSKESTHVHARFLDEHTGEALALMSEMLLAPALPPGEIDSERRVVLEEIAMYEDEPSERVHDVLSQAIFGDHPLGRRIIGDAEVIGSIPVAEIAAYHRARYRPDSVVVAAAGNLEHTNLAELASGALRFSAGREGEAPPPDGAPPGFQPRLVFYPKQTDQYHICFGGRGMARDDERRFALSVLDTALGGSMSSRLFREVREKRGLAYAVGSYAEQYVDSGAVATYLGTREDNVAEACEIVGRELGRLRDEGLPPEELDRAKEKVKGRLVLGMESTLGRMVRLAQSALFDLPMLTLDERLERIEAVTASDVAEIARELYDPAELSAACIGPDEGRFREAAGQVSEAYAAT